jgi:hypothetical protein
MYQKQKSPKPRVKQDRKWATFTYFGPETRTITKLFKNTDVGISFRIKYNVKHHLGIKRNTTDEYNLSSVYQLQCTVCPRRYIGQTRRMFRTRCKEHIRDLKNNGQYSKFAQHITETGHEYDTIEEAMKILHIEKISQILNTYERFHTYMKSVNKTYNDTFTET